MEEDRIFKMCYIPEKDPILKDLGLKICASSERKGGRIINKIVFERGDKSTYIEMAHQTVEVSDLPEELEDKMTPIPKFKRLEMSLMENYYHMRDFAKMLVDFGIENALEEAMIRERVSKQDVVEFNKLLRAEIVKKIGEVAPEVKEALEAYIE